MRYALMLLVLAGCAAEPRQQYAWAKDGATEQDLRQDYAQCRAQAFQNTMDLLQAAIIQTSCLEGKGWRQVPR